MRTCVLFTFVLLSFIRIDPSRAAGVTLWVGNDGADAGNCGARTSPCRSISQAIENASNGDTIEVGEGRYGDITGTGTFSGGGDEHGQLFPRDVGCIVCVTKALRILSLHGAAVTLIQGVANSQFNSTVVIAHDGVTFGGQGQGFTLTGSNQAGLTVITNVDNDFTTINIVAGIRISGNVDVGDGTGFSYSGPAFVDSPCPFCAHTGQVLFSNNEADNNGGTGFHIQLGLRDGEPILLENNVARNGGTGFFTSGGISGESGITQNGAGNVSFLNNVSIGNGNGYSAFAPGDIRDNTATGNSGYGFYIVPGGNLFTGNSAVGNGGPGVIVQYSLDGESPDVADLGPSAIPRFRSFSGNNFYGNDRNRPLLQFSVPAVTVSNAIYNPGPGAHCGVLNMGALIGPLEGISIPAITLNASGNYWGSTKGPSATGPGDAAGGACDQNNVTTVFKPFATAFL